MAKQKYKKPFWKSRTLRVNALLIVGGVVTSIAGQLEAGVTVTLTGVLNTILRVMTKKEITFKR